MSDLWWNIFFLAAGMVFMGFLVVAFRIHASMWRKVGQKEMQVNAMLQTVSPVTEVSQGVPENSPRGLPTYFDIKKIHTNTLYGKKYDIILSFEIVQFLVMLIMQGWDISMLDVEKDILETIKEQETEFPIGTNTIVVRRIQYNKDHTGTYYLEPLVNPSVKSVMS